ncbi:ATP-grasp domain-containing protein [Streptomyces sp. LHD-70]|uniref:ATP-grasp domain-containing protein n=1 Tax=Streptomyces sp. LHD-70 TaxID=3072140 RepID=UPI0028103304|nr:ATP-grasp domain-containing protein [Streptomyces sp. LHD-70]MDQ8706942.1 ATP-grasp domain-containing protein [Streptomyces sp. LHD-70]
MSAAADADAARAGAGASDAGASDAGRAGRMLFVGGANPLPSSVDIVTRAVAEAQARGIRVHLTHTEEMLARTPGVGALADAVSAVDPDDADAVERWVRARIAEGDRYDIVLGLRDTLQDSVARAARLLGVPGNSAEAVRRVRNKDACRAALAAAGFRQPAVRLCTSRRDAEEFLLASRGPWVVKPRDGMASIGVRKVLTVAELPDAVAALPDPDLFLVEEFVDGPEYSVEGVLLSSGPRVLAVTAKEVLPPPHFVEVGHVLPAELAEETRRAVERQVVAALDALELRFGVFHVELWLTADGVVLGEVHVRPGGDWLHLLLAHALPGLDLFGLLYDDVLGRAQRDPGPVSRGAAVRFLVAPPGRLTGVDGWDEVAAHPAVLRAELTVSPGELLAPVQQSGDRAGYLVVGAESPARARALAARLADRVTFRVDPVREGQEKDEGTPPPLGNILPS